MKKTKRLLSLLTALTITASAFAGMVIPASAEGESGDQPLYTMDIKSLTDATITKFVPDGENVAASDVAKYSVLDFGTGNSDAKIDAVPELDGWGYVHKAYLAAVTSGRQTNVHTVAAENAVYEQGVGNTGCKGSIYFIPANKDDLTVAADGVDVYTFTSIITTTGGAAEGSPEVGFLSAADASDVTAVDNVTLAASGVNNQANKYNMTLVNDKDNGKYYIYVNGILQKSGDSTAITGIYTRGVEKYVKSGIADLKLEQKDAAPNAVKVTFKGDADVELQSYDSVLSGTELTAPPAPSVSGKTFKEWQNDQGEAVTEFVAGEADTVYTAVYEEGSTVSTVNVTTNAFAKVTLKATAEGSSEIVKYTDVTGKVDFADIDKGDYTYSIEKKGYDTKTGTFTLGTENYALTDAAVLDEEHENYVYYEADWTNGEGVYGAGDNSDAKHRTFSTNLAASDVELPLTNDVPDVFTVHATVGLGSLGTRANSVGTWLLHSDKGVLLGVHWSKENGVFALTGWNGNAAPQDSADTIDKADNSIKLIEPTDDITGKLNIDFTVDAKNKSITVNYDGKTVGSLPIDATNIPEVDPENPTDENTKPFKALKSMNAGTYREKHEINVYELSVEKPDPMFMALTGDTLFAKVSGKTLTRTYSRSEAVITPDETFTWTAERANEVTKKGAKFTLTSAPAENMTAKAIVAACNDSGELKSIKTSDVTIEAGQTEVFVEETADNAKVMLWDSLESMEPLAPVEAVEEYTVKTEDETDMTGIAVADGVLSVTDEAKPGFVKITATGSTGKTASLVVEIKDFANVIPVVDGPKAYEVGQTGTYTVTSLVDEYKADVIDLFAPSFASDNTDVITIDAATGVATAVAAGTANITVTVGNPDKKAEVKIPVTVAAYSVTENATENSTVIDISSIPADTAIIGYQVTTATAEGAKVNQTIVAKDDVTDNKITADTTGATKVEVAPVYKVEDNTIASADERYTFNVPADTYDISITMSGERADLYVNNQLVVNNMLQYGSGPATDVMNDVVVNEGYAKMRTEDYSNGKSAANSTVSMLQIVKSPSIVTRKPKMYVMGDSLVAKYYNGGSKENPVMTGWGQVLQNYIDDSVEVVDIANSGADSIGIADTQFTRILGSAKAGDYMVLESGYNDKGHSIGEAVLEERITYMTTEADKLGVKVILVSPNASTTHDYTESVAWTSTMTSTAEKLADKAKYINLSKLSYNFIHDRYPDTTFVAGEGLSTIYNIYGGAERGVHSTFHAANCWASLVATELGKLGYSDIVNTEYSYTFNDGTNDITVSAALAAETEPTE